MKQKVLFVCLGNICRSPVAEEILRVRARQAGVEGEFDSAGLIDYHQGELPDPRMRRCAATRGYRLTHRSRPVRPDDFGRFDLIIPMDAANLRALSRMASTDAERAKLLPAASLLMRHTAEAVPDPYYGTDSDFLHVIDLLEDVADTLIGRLKEEG